MIIDTERESRRERAIKVLVISNDSLAAVLSLNKSQKCNNCRHLIFIDLLWKAVSYLPDHGPVIGVGVGEPELLGLVAAVILLRAPEPPDCRQGECRLLTPTSPRVKTPEDGGAEDLAHTSLNSLI